MRTRRTLRTLPGMEQDLSKRRHCPTILGIVGCSASLWQNQPQETGGLRSDSDHSGDTSWPEPGGTQPNGSLSLEEAGTAG